MLGCLVFSVLCTLCFVRTFASLYLVTNYNRNLSLEKHPLDYSMYWKNCFLFTLSTFVSIKIYFILIEQLTFCLCNLGMPIFIASWSNLMRESSLGIPAVRKYPASPALVNDFSINQSSSVR